MTKKKEKKPNYQAKLFSFKYLLHDIVKWLMFWKGLIWYRIKKIFDGPDAKKKIKGKAIICSNHVGFSDPFVLQCTFLYRRFHFVYMKELTKCGFTKWIYKNVFLSFPIDRDKPSFQTMRFLSEYVKGGNLLAMFPEGHIKRDGVMDEYKGGVVLIAYLSDTPIIPVYREKRSSIWRMSRVAIGKPFNVREKIGPVMNQDKLNQVANELYAYELQLKEMCQRKKK